MKIDETIVQAVSSDEFKTIAFRVDQKMAQVIFRDKLYTAEGRLRVIAQEYMANARDAHRAAGKSDTPIEVTLPTNLRHEFVVRDYGNGIPPNIIEDVFVVYGASTKNKNNIENGGYGIGAKCAFSYVNAFSVTTTVQGVRYIYAASIDSAGMNQFVLMDTGPATGPDGTEIRVPIKVNDITSLRTWVKEITHSWSPRPDFGTETVQYLDVPTEMTGDRWELYNRVSPYGYRMFVSGITVTADDIPYTLTRDQVTSINPGAEVLYDLLREKQYCLVLHFKNGELTIPPQRESVDMTPRSKNAIAAAVDKVVNHLVKKAEDEFAAATTPLEKVSMALREDFYLEVARKASNVLKADIALYGKEFETATAGIRVYEGRYNSKLFRDFEERETVSLTKLASPKRGANWFIVDTKGKKMAPSDLKRLIRGHRELTYGDIFLVAVHDKAAFLKEAGVDVDTLVRVGDYSFAERDETARAKMRTSGGYFFLKGFKLSYSNYSGTHACEDTRTKVSSMSTHAVYIDTEGGEPVYEGKVITRDRLCELAHLHHLLTHRDIGMTWLQSWEERFEEEYRPSDYTFLEDALLEAVEDALKLPYKDLVALAVKGAHRYKPAQDWPGISRHDWIPDLCEALGYNESFSGLLRTVVTLENTEIDSDNKNDRKYVKKIWGLLDDETRAPLDTALKNAIGALYDVRTEFLKMAYSSSLMPLFMNLMSTNHRITLRNAGTDVPVDWKRLLTDSLKTYTINPAYKATP